MGLASNLFKGVFRRETAIKAADRAGVVARKAALKNPPKMLKVLEKPRGMTTRTVAHAEGPGVRSVLKEQSKAIIGSKPIKYAGQVAGAATIIGGGVYVLGKGAKTGLSSIGYGVRDITGNRTAEDQREKQLDLYERQTGLDADALDNMKKYSDFLLDNQLSDSPSARDIFDRYFLENRGEPVSNSDEKTTFGDKALKTGGILAGLAIATVAGVAIYKANKKGGK